MISSSDKTKVVCIKCKKRLFDIDDPETYAAIEIKCPRCGTVNCIRVKNHKIRAEQTGAYA